MPANKPIGEVAMTNKIKQVLIENILSAIEGWTLGLVSTQQMGLSPAEANHFLDALYPEDYGARHVAQTMAYYKGAPRH
jgi:hypothetical protein